MGLEVGAMVFDAAVVEDVRANLRTPFDLLLTGFHLCLCLTAFLHL